MRLYEIKQTNEEKILELLQTDFSQAFSALKDSRMLFRGSNFNDSFRVYDTNDAIRSSKSTYDLYNVILAKIGEQDRIADRKKSVICTNDIFIAKNYNSHLTVVLPANDATISYCSTEDIWNEHIDLWGYGVNLKDMNEMLHNTFINGHDYGESGGLQELKVAIEKAASSKEGINKIITDTVFIHFNDQSSIEDVYKAFKKDIQNVKPNDIKLGSNEFWIQGKVLQISIKSLIKLCLHHNLEIKNLDVIFHNAPTDAKIGLLSDDTNNTSSKFLKRLLKAHESEYLDEAVFNEKMTMYPRGKLFNLLSSIAYEKPELLNNELIKDAILQKRATCLNMRFFAQIIENPRTTFASAMSFISNKEIDEYFSSYAHPLQILQSICRTAIGNNKQDFPLSYEKAKDAFNYFRFHKREALFDNGIVSSVGIIYGINSFYLNEFKDDDISKIELYLKNRDSDMRNIIIPVACLFSGIGTFYNGESQILRWFDGLSEKDQDVIIHIYSNAPKQFLEMSTTKIHVSTLRNRVKK